MKTTNISIEELLVKKGEFKEKAEVNVDLYNQENKSDTRDSAKVVKYRNDAEEACSSYNGVSKLVAYYELRQTERPIITAVERLSYPTISVRQGKQTSDVDVPDLVLTEGFTLFDLIDIDKNADIEFASKDWKSLARTLNHRVVYMSAKKFGADCKFVAEYSSMLEVSKQIAAGERPLSLANMTAALHESVRAIIGTDWDELFDTVIGEDNEGNPLTVGNACMNYIQTVFNKKGKRVLSTECGKDGTFVKLLAEVCHLLVTGESIEVGSKSIEAEIKKAQRKQARAAAKAQKKSVNQEATIIDALSGLNAEQLAAVAAAIEARKG